VAYKLLHNNEWSKLNDSIVSDNYNDISKDIKKGYIYLYERIDDPRAEMKYKKYRNKYNKLKNKLKLFMKM
jgi:hypothetical protein